MGNKKNKKKAVPGEMPGTAKNKFMRWWESAALFYKKKPLQWYNRFTTNTK